MENPTKNLHFPGQNPDETLIDFWRPHWVMLIPQFLIFVIVLVFFGFIALHYRDLQAEHAGDFFWFASLLTSALVLYYVHHFFHFLIRHHLTVTIVTDTRIVITHRSLFLINETQMIDLQHIQEVKMLQSGVIQTVFGFGMLHIVLSSTNESVILPFVPHPDFHFRLINKAAQIFKNRIAATLNL